MIQRLANGNIRVVLYHDNCMFTYKFTTYEEFAEWRKTLDYKYISIVKRRLS